MSENNAYQPPRVWKWDPEKSGGAFSKTNRPTAGPTHAKELQRGTHPLQLFSQATPNGVKITVMLEELLAIGKDAEYDAYPIRILDGDQFGSGFVELNPNSKIPALLDQSVSPPQRVFESGAILLYLAEKFAAFIPQEPRARTEVLSWLFWQMGSAPFLAGGFGHFYSYAPTKIEYAIDRFTLETKRQLDVLNRQLEHNKFIGGGEYSIADIAIWPWYGSLVLNQVYSAAEFLEAETYAHVMRWAKQIAARPAVQRGLKVNRTWGPLEGQLHERHDAADFETKTQDKVQTS